MTIIYAILRQARKIGVSLEPAGEKLAVVSSRGKCPPGFASLLLQHKPALLRLVNKAPHLGSVPLETLALNTHRPSPSTKDARATMAFVMEQIGDSPEQLCEWCCRREALYWEAFRWA